MAAITLEELLMKVGIHPEKLNDSISDDNLLEVALFLTSWRTVIPYLGLSEMDVNDIEQGGKNEKDKRLKALQIWKGKFGFKATYKKLVGVLLSLGMADGAEKVCHLLKGICRSSCTSQVHAVTVKFSAWGGVAIRLFQNIVMILLVVYLCTCAYICVCICVSIQYKYYIS